MILDRSCDINGCNSPVEFVKGQNFNSSEGIITVYFLRCLSQHYYMKYKENIETKITAVQDRDSDSNFVQPELPFGDEL